MSLFPSVTPGIPLVTNPKWRTIISNMESGKENRTQTWVFPKRKITLLFPVLTLTDAKSILNFFNNTCKGARYSFRWVHPVSETWTKEYVAQGDDSTVTFTLPCTNGSAGTTTMYIDDVETGGTFGDGAGADGLDQFTFVSAPTSGTLITSTFTGQWTPEVRFEDEISSEYLLYDVVTMRNLTFMEVRT